MPSPSYWPFVLALGLPIMGYGFVFKWWWLLAIGALIAFFGINAWTIEPATDRGAPLMAQARRHQRGVEPGRRATRDAHQTNTGVSNNKLAMWVFLASESLVLRRVHRHVLPLPRA